MSAVDHVEAFDTSLEKTYAWRNELARVLGILPNDIFLLLVS
jgi:hypothetical protein